MLMLSQDQITELAQKAGVRLFGGWIEGSQKAIYRFAELIVDQVEDANPHSKLESVDVHDHVS